MPQRDSPRKNPEHPPDEMEAMLHAACAAEGVLKELETPKNCELRGRSQRESLERIEHFLDSDQLYKAVESYYAAHIGDDAKLQIFRGAVEERLKIFERLATRNEDIDVGQAVQNDYRWTYRRLTNEVLGHLIRHGANVRGPSIYRLEFLKEYAAEVERSSLDSIETPTADRIDGAAGTGIASGVAQETQEDLELFNLFVDFTAGRLLSYSAVAGLMRRLAVRLEDSSQSTFVQLIQPHLDDAWLAGELKRAGELLDACEHWKSCSPVSALETGRLHRLIDSFRENPLYGFSRHDPFEQLQNEGVLTAGMKVEIQRAGATLCSSSTLVRGAVAGAEERGFVVTCDAYERLEKAVFSLKAAGISEQRLSVSLQKLQKRGTAQIEHLESLAELARTGISVGRYLAVSERGAAAIAETAQEVREGSYSTRRMRASLVHILESRLSIARDVPEPIVQTVASAVSAQQHCLDPKTRQEVVEILTAYGQQCAVENRNQVLSDMSADLLCLSGINGSVGKCRDMALTPSGDNSMAQMRSFISAVSDLHRLGIEGVDRLIHNAHVVWERELAGTPNVALSGFLVEASSLRQLIRLGYSLERISLDGMGLAFPFDGLGRTPDGTPCGIEIKSRLSTVSRKETESLEDSQLARFMTACEADNLKPIIAVADVRREELWASAHLRSLLARIEEDLGLRRRPQFINVQSGGEIDI